MHPYTLLQLKRPRIKLIIRSLLGDQLLVVASLDDAAVVEDHNDVGVHDGGESVCDDEHGASVHEAIHTALDDGFGAGIDGGGGLVENHDGRVGHGGTGDGDELALTL